MNKESVLEVERQFKEVLFEIKKEGSNKAIVFLGGIHGNETSGYVALEKSAEAIKNLADSLDGDVYAFGGNMQALIQNKRFIEKDLNRIWLQKNVNRIESGDLRLDNAENEWLDFVRIYSKLKEILKEKKELFIIDLHTTSSPSVPFITINDMIKNRDYSLKFPVPIIIGIEEYLAGPLLSYMNDFGHVSMAFEAGQHDSKTSIDAQEAFVWMALVNAGILPSKKVAGYEKHVETLKNLVSFKDVFEVRYRKEITKKDQFQMRPGFSNFSNIHKDQVLATDKKGEITATEKGKIFMPLYQKEGSDGFFIIKRVPYWALGLSKFLRRINFESILPLLPGISRREKDKNTLVVNPKVARFMSVQIFHLLGFRRKKTLNGKHLFSKREISTTSKLK